MRTIFFLFIFALLSIRELSSMENQYTPFDVPLGVDVRDEKIKKNLDEKGFTELIIKGRTNLNKGNREELAKLIAAKSVSINDFTNVVDYEKTAGTQKFNLSLTYDPDNNKIATVRASGSLQVLTADKIGQLKILHDVVNKILKCPYNGLRGKVDNKQLSIEQLKDIIKNGSDFNSALVVSNSNIALGDYNSSQKIHNDYISLKATKYEDGYIVIIESKVVDQAKKANDEFIKMTNAIKAEYDNLVDDSKRNTLKEKNNDSGL